MTLQRPIQLNEPVFLHYFTSINVRPDRDKYGLSSSQFFLFLVSLRFWEPCYFHCVFGMFVLRYIFLLKTLELQFMVVMSSQLFQTQFIYQVVILKFALMLLFTFFSFCFEISYLWLNSGVLLLFNFCCHQRYRKMT